MNVPNWLKGLDTSPLVVVVAVVFGAAMVAALVLEGLPSIQSLGPILLALFVVAMIVLDLRRRD